MTEFKQAISAVVNLGTSVGLSAEAGDKMSEYGKFGKLMTTLAFTNQDQLSKAYDVKAESDSKASVGVLTQRQVTATLDELNLSAKDMVAVLNHMTTLSQLLQKRPELLKEFFELCKIQQSFKNGDASFVGDRIGSLAAFALKAFGIPLAGSIAPGVAVGITLMLIAAEKGIDFVAAKKLEGIQTGLQKIDHAINQSVIATLNAMSSHKKFEPFKAYIDAAIKEITSGGNSQKALDALNSVKMLRDFTSSRTPSLDLREHLKINNQITDQLLEKTKAKYQEVTEKLSRRTTLDGHDPVKLATEQRSLQNTITALEEKRKAVEKIMPAPVNFDMTPKHSRSLSQGPAQRQQIHRTPLKIHADPALTLDMQIINAKKPTVIHLDPRPLSSRESTQPHTFSSSRAPASPNPSSAPPVLHFSYSTPKRSTSTPMDLSAMRGRSTSSTGSLLTSSNGFFHKRSPSTSELPKHTTSPPSSSQSRSKGMALGAILE